MVKCEIHNVTMIKTGRREYVCPECNGMTKDELINHLKNNK